MTRPLRKKRATTVVQQHASSALNYLHHPTVRASKKPPQPADAAGIRSGGR
jgi:hypothetical protein